MIRLSLLVLLCGFVMISGKPEDSLNPSSSSMVETFVTYSPHCGKPLCPASPVTSVIRGYECDCSKKEEHTRCDCASGGHQHHHHKGKGHHKGHNLGVHCDGENCPGKMDCQCEDHHKECLCDALKTNERIEVKPRLVPATHPDPLAAPGAHECEPNVFGMSPGNCRTDAKVASNPITGAHHGEPHHQHHSSSSIHSLSSGSSSVLPGLPPPSAGSMIAAMSAAIPGALPPAMPPLVGSNAAVSAAISSFSSAMASQAAAGASSNEVFSAPVASTSSPTPPPAESSAALIPAAMQSVASASLVPSLVPSESSAPSAIVPPNNLSPKNSPAQNPPASGF